VPVAEVYAEFHVTSPETSNVWLPTWQPCKSSFTVQPPLLAGVATSVPLPPGHELARFCRAAGDPGVVVTTR